MLNHLYGTVKTHKDGFPMRPIISTIGSVSYSLSKFLVNMLQPLVGSISNSHIINAVDFVDKVSPVYVDQNDVLVSFDVRSLFTCVPVNDVLEYLAMELNKYVFSIPTPFIISLIRLCVVDTCFVFNDNFYRQKFGMQMGSCLSPVLSNIYMEFYEARIANGIIPEGTLWFRYVDDVFCIWKNDADIDAFLVNLNFLVPSIQFTVEKETNGGISFLDVKVIRETPRLKFRIHRKQTNNNLIINAKSTHLKDVKYMALRSMFLRALRLVSPEFLDEEFNYIIHIGRKNNFTVNQIDECLSLAKKTFYKTGNNHKFENSNTLVLPFHPCFSNVIYPLKLLNIHTVFSYNSTIGRTLIRNRPKHENGVIYKIPCECGKYYVGQTGKDVNKRISQHQYCIRRDSPNNAINLHVNQCGSPILWNETQILYKQNNFHLRNILETACINYSMQHNFNTSQGLFKLNPLVSHVIAQQYKIKSKF